jgi:U3 small nucleolar ribonucleoprotein component
MNPDTLVENNGQNITITRVSSFDVTADGIENVEREYEQTKGIISNPSEDLAQRLEGTIDEGSITVTVTSDTDVEAQPDAGKDRIIKGHVDPSTASDVEVYTVVSLQDDEHPLMGIKKLTAVCNRFNREDLQDDADTYVSA